MKSIVLVILIAACGAPQAGETLSESVQAYNESVRWGRYAVAANHLPAAERPARVDEWDQLATELKITDYEVVNVVQHGSREAKVQVKMSWYKSSEGTVHETHAVQTWERHGKDWFMVEEARVRGTEMPGLPEPLMKD